MIRVIKNSALVLVLGGLLFLPIFASQTIQYEPSESPSILGVQAVHVVPAHKQAEVIDQIDLKLTVSDDGIQKFYNVLPEKYINDNYQVLVIVSADVENAGFEVILEENELSADLVVAVDEDATLSTLPVTLIVLK